MTHVHKDEVTEGSRLQADDGFTCLTKDQIVEVKRDPDGYVFIPCAEGAHYLCGQLNDTGHYVGLRLVP